MSIREGQSTLLQPERPKEWVALVILGLLGVAAVIATTWIGVQP